MAEIFNNIAHKGTLKHSLSRRNSRIYIYQVFGNENSKIRNMRPPAALGAAYFGSLSFHIRKLLRQRMFRYQQFLKGLGQLSVQYYGAWRLHVEILALSGSRQLI